MNRELKACLVVLLTAIAIDALAELYFVAKRNNLTVEFADYLRSKHGKFERYYAERSRRHSHGGGASATEGRGMDSNADVDNGNGNGGENAS